MTKHELEKRIQEIAALIADRTAGRVATEEFKQALHLTMTDWGEVVGASPDLAEAIARRMTGRYH